MTFAEPSAPTTFPAAWVQVCDLQDIPQRLGVCALVGGEQVALFRIAGRVYAVGNRDPFTGANVMSRGLTGRYMFEGEVRLKVVSPMLKHAFDLESGHYVYDEYAAQRLPVYPVRVEGGAVWIGSAA